MSKKGRLFIISGPSGTGKSTLIEAVLRKRPELCYSISHTTRPPRGNEKDGVEYYFVSEADFRKKRETGDFAEWAEVHGHFYGTSASFIENAMKDGDDVLLDIDVVGAQKLLARYPEAVSIFVAPPALEVLEKRLTGRKTDSLDAMKRRLLDAEEEMTHADLYDHVVINEDLQQAISEIEIILETASVHG
jgi:guanylate kinase